METLFTMTLYPDIKSVYIYIRNGKRGLSYDASFSKDFYYFVSKKIHSKEGKSIVNKNIIQDLAKFSLKCFKERISSNKEFRFNLRYYAAKIIYLLYGTGFSYEYINNYIDEVVKIAQLDIKGFLLYVSLKTGLEFLAKINSKFYLISPIFDLKIIEINIENSYDLKFAIEHSKRSSVIFYHCSIEDLTERLIFIEIMRG